MNTWELMQLQKSDPGLLGLTQQDFAFAPDDMAWQAHRQRDTYKDQSPQQILASYAGAPGRFGQLFQGIASGAQPKDRKFMEQMYGILQSVTPEERAWVQQHPDWMQAYGKLEGAGYIKDTKSEGMGNVVNTFADKVLLPLTKMVVMGAVGMGIGGAIGYGAGLTSGQGLFGLGPELGLSGPWGGEALTGAEGLGAMGGAAGDTLGATSAPIGTDMIMGGQGWETLGNNFLPGLEYSTAGDLATGALGAGAAGGSLWGKVAGMPGKAMDSITNNPLGSLATLGGAAMGLGAASGGGKDLTSTTESTVDPRYWAYADPMLQAGLGMLPGQMQATAAMQPQLQSTLGGLLNAPDVANNPWVRNYSNALSQDAWGQWQENAIPSIASAFSLAGRYGGSSGGNQAYGNAIGKSATDLQRSLNAQTAGLYSNAYGQGLNAAQGGLTQAPAVSQMPWLPLTNYSGLLAASPWSKTSTQTSPGLQSNPYAGALGGALTGAALWKNLSGGWA